MPAVHCLGETCLDSIECRCPCEDCSSLRRAAATLPPQADGEAPTAPAMLTAKRCACGWLRPLISIGMRDLSLPPAGIVPFYCCPSCGTPYAAGEVSKDVVDEYFQRVLGRSPGTQN